MSRRCAICGGSAFKFAPVLWAGLIAEWRLSPDEADYVDRQQGECCATCGGNLRSILLARMICQALDRPEPLATLVPTLADIKILEINEAGTLSPILRTAPAHTFGAYPEVDMHALPYGDQSFDIVVHSDTLEHVEHPVRALAECRRVLKLGGACCFTVPVIVGRLSASREGLPPSYHGDPTLCAEDQLVRTEFGADLWTYLARARFDHIEVSTLDFPSATAWMGRRLST